MADNKSQHYVPKYSLKYFSSDPACKKISLINIKRRMFVNNASLKKQCCRDYFYGTSLIAERALSKLEGVFSSLTRETVISGKVDPRQGYHVAIMMALQKARTLHAEQELNWTVNKIAKTLMYSKIDESILRDINIGVNSGVNLNIQQALLMSPILVDMKQFILVNHTEIPFIIGDNPVVSTNWFCRARMPQRWSAGMASSGLQMLMPLSPKHALFLHDSNVYLANGAQSTLHLKRPRTVTALNEMQWLTHPIQRIEARAAL